MIIITMVPREHKPKYKISYRYPPKNKSNL